MSSRIRSPSRDEGDRPAVDASGATWPMQNPAVPPENRPSVTSMTSLPSPAPLIARGDGEHLAHARAALGALVADDDDVAGLDRARASRRVHRVLLAVEDPGRALEHRLVDARRLHDRTLWAPATPAGSRCRPVGWIGSVSGCTTRRRASAGELGEVLGHRLAGHGQASPCSSPASSSSLHHHRHAADAVDVVHHVACRTASCRRGAASGRRPG